MPDLRLPIDEEKIVELYKNGYSQNDIVKQYAVSVVQTRAILQAAGFNTRGYRTLSPAAMKVIEVLVRAGSRYTDIDTVCDISYHAIRDYVKRKNICQKRGASSLGIASFPKRDEFLAAYREGKSFCLLFEEMELSDSEIVPAFQCIHKEDIEKHRESLHQLIQKYEAEGVSKAGIARLLDISRSLLRNGVKW